jgi:cobaltochelatase CobS
MSNATVLNNVVELNASDLPVMEYLPVDKCLPELGAQFPAIRCTNPGIYARLVPQEPTHYYVPVLEAKKAVIWTSTPAMKQSLLLKGETGTGKTELVTFLAARMGIPLARVECHCSMTPDVLDGGIRLVPSEDGSGVITRYILSDVMRLYRDGGWILLDEVDKVSDEVSSRLHALADGKPVTIPETGEVIYKHPNTRVWGTANTVGDGTSMRYITSRPLDAAFRARWAVLEVKYLKPTEELEMLKNAYPRLREGFLSAMIRLANECRDAALGPKRDGDVERPMGVIFATRSLRNIMEATLAFGAQAPFIEAVNFAFRDMCTTADQEVFDGICQRVLGVDLTKELTTTKKLNDTLQ